MLSSNNLERLATTSVMKECKIVYKKILALQIVNGLPHKDLQGTQNIPMKNPIHMPIYDIFLVQEENIFIECIHEIYEKIAHDSWFSFVSCDSIVV